MDSGSTVMGLKSGKEKHPKRQKENEGEDIINNLPESIISCILSLLPIKDAVRTSVLSKKWIYRWTFITKLDLNDHMFYSPETETIEKQNLANFVNKALLLTACSDISLVFYHKYDVSLVNTWISSILNCNVKYFYADLHFELPFSDLSSHFLFNNSSLEELDMKVCRCAIRVPRSYVCFRHLKILKLSGIIFALDSPSKSEDLKLSLPVLKILETKNCTFAKGVTLEVPLLERVFIEQYPDSDWLSYEPLNCAIKFSASPLTEFTYSGYGYIPQCIILLDPSSVHNASVNINLGFYRKKDGSRTSMLLKQFRDVKDLKFDGWEVLTQPKLDILPVFGMLSHLELGFVTIKILFGFLFKSPVLKTLVIKEISIFDEELLNSTPVPECLTSTLQVVKFEKLRGIECELCLAKFLMKNGFALERMSFTICYWWIRESEVIDKFREKLISIKKLNSFKIDLYVNSRSIHDYD